jgi:hypothetical protein
MTKNRTRKRLVRSRAAKTGESYTTALWHLRRPKEESVEQETDSLTCTFCGSGPDADRKLVVGEGAAVCSACVDRLRDVADRAEPGATVRLMPKSLYQDAKAAVVWALRSGSPTGREVAARMQRGEQGMSPAEIEAMKSEWSAAGQPE